MGGEKHKRFPPFHCFPQTCHPENLESGLTYRRLVWIANRLNILCVSTNVKLCERGVNPRQFNEFTSVNFSNYSGSINVYWLCYNYQSG